MQQDEKRTFALKAGPNGTRKREDAQVSLRKDKRENALAQRRHAPQTQQTVAPAQWTLDRYNKAALLAGSPDQLTLLGVLLETATKDQAEAHLRALLWDPDDNEPVVLRFLLAHLFSTGSETALRALVNATHHTTTHDVPCALTIVQSGYLPKMAQTIKQQGPALSPVMHALMWELAVNVACGATEARQVVLEQCCPPAGALPFLEVLGWANVKHNSELQSALIHLTRALAIGHSPPPEWVRSVVVQLVTFVMNDVQPMAYREMHPAHLVTLHRAVESLTLFIRALGSEEREQFLMPVFRQAGLERVLSHLVHLCEAQNASNQVALLELLGTFSQFNTQTKDFHDAAHKVGLFRLLVHNTQRPDSAAARAHAFRSLGNYLDDYYESVRYVFQAGGAPEILKALRLERSPVVRQQAVFALSSLVLACEYTWRNKMDISGEADAVLTGLVAGQRMLQLVAPYLDMSEPRTAEDALHIIAACLRWNRKLTLHHVGEEEAEDRIQVMLNQMKTRDIGTAMYNMICEVQEVLEVARADSQAMDEGPETMHPVDDGKPFFF